MTQQETLQHSVKHATLKEVCNAAIAAALERNNGNRTNTAAELKISIRTLRNHIRTRRQAGDFIPGPYKRDRNSVPDRTSE